MIKQKIAENYYEIYIVDDTPVVEYDFYRQDIFSFTIKALNPIDDPFDFSIYDTFRAQIRVGDPRNKKIEYTFTVSDPFINELTDEVVLGKSVEAQNEFDELSLVTPDGFDFKKPYSVVWVDVEGIIKQPFGQQDLEHETFIKIKVNMDPDVTR